MSIKTGKLQGGWHADDLPEYKHAFSFGTRDSAPGEFYLIRWYGLHGKKLAVDSNDRIIVSDTGNKRIQVFSPEGKLLIQMGKGYIPPARVDDAGNRIKIISGTARELGAIFAVDVDADNRIIAVESDRPNRIVVFSEDGDLIKSHETQRYWPFGNLDISAANGEIFVLDKYYQKMDVFDSELEYRRSFDIYAKDFGSKMFIDRAGNTYLFDRSHAEVKVYDGEGDYLFGLPMYPFHPSGGVVSNDVICVRGAREDRENYLYFYNLRSKELIYKLNIGQAYPASMALDSKNRLIIADDVNNEIHVFEPM